MFCQVQRHNLQSKFYCFFLTRTTTAVEDFCYEPHAFLPRLNGTRVVLRVITWTDWSITNKKFSMKLSSWQAQKKKVQKSLTESPIVICCILVSWNCCTFWIKSASPCWKFKSNILLVVKSLHSNHWPDKSKQPFSCSPQVSVWGSVIQVLYYQWKIHTAALQL